MSTERADPPELQLDSWISALGRMSPTHPDIARILHIVDRLQDRPSRSHAVIYGEPGTGKDGLGQLLHRLMHPDGGPCVRVGVLGRSASEVEAELFGTAPSAVFAPGGAFARARGGSLLIDELLALPPSCQRRLQELLSAQKWLHEPKAKPADDSSQRAEASSDWSEPEAPLGDSDRRRTFPSPEAVRRDRLAPRRQLLSRRLTEESQEWPAVVVIGLSDGDIDQAVATGGLRHDLAYKLGRIVLKVPPLRERPDDLSQAALWTANRLLRSRGILRVAEFVEGGDLDSTSRPSSGAGGKSASDSDPGLSVPVYQVTAEALAALHAHRGGWPGNFRELEAVLERAILLYSDGELLRGSDVERALTDRWNRSSDDGTGSH
jgi:DNA-binding NtrC family response regulator